MLSSSHLHLRRLHLSLLSLLPPSKTLQNHDKFTFKSFSSSSFAFLLFDDLKSSLSSSSSPSSTSLFHPGRRAFSSASSSSSSSSSNSKSSSSSSSSPSSSVPSPSSSFLSDILSNSPPEPLSPKPKKPKPSPSTFTSRSSPLFAAIPNSANSNKNNAKSNIDNANLPSFSSLPSSASQSTSSSSSMSSSSSSSPPSSLPPPPSPSVPVSPFIVSPPSSHSPVDIPLDSEIANIVPSATVPHIPPPVIPPSMLDAQPPTTFDDSLNTSLSPDEITASYQWATERGLTPKRESYQFRLTVYTFLSCFLIFFVIYPTILYLIPDKDHPTRWIRDHVIYPVFPFLKKLRWYETHKIVYVEEGTEYHSGDEVEEIITEDGKKVVFLNKKKILDERITGTDHSILANSQMDDVDAASSSSVPLHPVPNTKGTWDPSTSLSLKNDQMPLSPLELSLVIQKDIALPMIENDQNGQIAMNTEKKNGQNPTSPSSSHSSPVDLTRRWLGYFPDKYLDPISNEAFVEMVRGRPKKRQGETQAQDQGQGKGEEKVEGKGEEKAKGNGKGGQMNLPRWLIEQKNPFYKDKSAEKEKEN